MGVRIGGFPLGFRCTACTHLIVTLRKYAGRTGRCPGCNEQQVIPDRIQFACPCCEDQVRLTGKWVGRRILCPRCEEVIRVPGASPEEDWRQDEPAPAGRPAPFFEPLESAGPGLVKTASEIRSVSLDELGPEPSQLTLPSASDRYAPSLDSLSEEFLPGDELIDAAVADAPSEDLHPGDERVTGGVTSPNELFGISGEEFRQEDAGGLFGLSGEDLQARELFGLSDEIRLTEHDPVADDEVANLVNAAVAEAAGPRIEYPAS